MDINSQEHIKAIAPEVARAYQLGKEQKYDDAYNVLVPHFEAKEIPSYFEEPCGWTIYRYLKNNENKLSSLEIRKALSFYLSFASCKPSTLHSCIMVQAVNLEKKHENDFRFIEFCLMWNLESLRDEDYKSAKLTTESGKNLEYQSLAEDIATRLYREMKSRHSLDFAIKLYPFFEKVKDTCPSNRFISMYLAQLLYWQEKTAESLDAYKTILRNTPEWYIWKSLGDIVEDNDLRISFYCKALTMMGKEEYIGDLRLKLATLLLEKNKEQAAYEIEQYMVTYKDKGWNISGDVYLLQAKLQDITPSTQSKAFYRSNIEAAENYAYSDIPIEEFVFVETFRNQEGKERAKLVSKIKHLEIKPSVSPIMRKAKSGEIFLVRLAKKNGRFVPLTIHETGKIVESMAKDNRNKKETVEKKTIVGIVSLPIKGNFCFIDHTYYVPDGIRKSHNLQEGQTVTAKVKQLPDGKWRVISIVGGK